LRNLNGSKFLIQEMQKAIIVPLDLTSILRIA